MADSKTIAVVGGTGSQGGGLVRAILDDPDGGFAARVLTRDATGDTARALAERGAEVVEADVADQASLEAAFDGAWGAYCVTFFWEHFSPDAEKEHAANMARAAEAAGLHHVIWSTLEDTRDWIPLDDDRMPTLSEGRYKVPHFDAKAEADAFFEAIDVPVTYLLTSFYWDNLIHFGMHPQRGDDGVLTFNLPMGEEELSGIAAEDIGKCAHGIFRAGDRYQGQRVGIAGEHLTGAEMAAALTEALGETVRYQHVPFDVYRGLGFPGADDLGNMFQFYHDFPDAFKGARPLDRARRLNPELKSFADWLAENADRLPIASD